MSIDSIMLPAETEMGAAAVESELAGWPDPVKNWGAPGNGTGGLTGPTLDPPRNVGLMEEISIVYFPGGNPLNS